MTTRVAALMDRFGDIHHLFEDLAPGVRAKLVSLAVARTLGPREEIANVTRPVDGLYLIVDGSLRVGSLSADGKQLLVAIMEAGDIFGVISVMDEKPSLHFASAGGPTTVIFLPAAPFRDLVFAHPVLTRRMMTLVAQRARLSFAVNDRFGLTETHYRVARCLSDISDFFSPSPARSDLELAINQYDLSSMLAISRQSVNRELKELEKKNLVSIGYNRIWVKDLTRLRAYLT